MSKSFLIRILFFTSFILICSLKDGNSGKPLPVSFKIVSQDNLKPVSDRKIYIFNGDYEFDLAKFSNPYPYNKSAEKMSWYIKTVKSDAKGKFELSIMNIKVKNIILQAGKPYQLINIEKASNLAHSFSNSSIRIVNFKKNSRIVECNSIYDLNRGSFKKICLDGTTTKAPFKNIQLIAQSIQ